MQHLLTATPEELVSSKKAAKVRRQRLAELNAADAAELFAIVVDENSVTPDGNLLANADENELRDLGIRVIRA